MFGLILNTQKSLILSLADIDAYRFYSCNTYGR